MAVPTDTSKTSAVVPLANASFLRLMVNMHHIYPPQGDFGPKLTIMQVNTSSIHKTKFKNRFACWMASFAAV